MFAVGFQNSATSLDWAFYAARSYSLMRPPRTGRCLTRSLERSAGGGRAAAGGVGLGAGAARPLADCHHDHLDVSWWPAFSGHAFLVAGRRGPAVCPR